VIPLDIILDASSSNQLMRFSKIGKLYKLIRMTRMAKLLMLLKKKKTISSKLS